MYSSIALHSYDLLACVHLLLTPQKSGRELGVRTDVRRLMIFIGRKEGRKEGQTDTEERSLKTDKDSADYKDSGDTQGVQ